MRRILGKMEGVKLLSVGIDFDLQFHTYNGWEYRGIAKYRIGFKTYKVQFIYLEKTKYKVAFLCDNYVNYTIPTDRLQNEALLVLIRGEIEKFFGRMEQIKFFKERREQEEEEKARLEKEEEEKRIALGEQISFEKYLKNVDK